jgi:guanylate kinase
VDKKGKIFVFSAPSGGGKTTILNYLRKKMPSLVYSISATTRPPRTNEIDGVHYFFMTVEEFEKKIAMNAFAEWAKVHDNYYGTPREFIDKTIAQGNHIVMDIDVQGKVQFDAVYPESIGILILPPGQSELERRLRGRNTDSEEVIQTRLRNARWEIDFAKSNGKYEYTVVNDHLDDAQAQILSIIDTETR